MLPHHEAAGMPQYNHIDSAQAMSPALNDEKDVKSHISSSPIDEKHGSIITVESIEDDTNCASAPAPTVFDHIYKRVTILSSLVSVPLCVYLITSDTNSEDWVNANALLALRAALLIVFHVFCGSYRLGRGRARGKGSVPWQVDAMSAVLQAGLCALHYRFARKASIDLATREDQVMTILPINLY